MSEGGEYYLLPYDVDDTSEGATKATGISVTDLQDMLAQLSRAGSVLLLLDSCPRGGTGVELSQRLSASGISVISASTGSESCLENAQWESSAFTKVLLAALGGAADIDKSGLVSVTELASYVQQELPRLTNNRQSPSIVLRFVKDIVSAR
jgi:uncharacterized caspase-like protein